MHKINKRSLNAMCWNALASTVKPVNGDLYRLFSYAHVDRCCDLIPLEYSFGDLIVKDSRLQTTEGPVFSKHEEPDDYFLVVLNKPLEQFILLPSRPISLNIFNPGSIIHLSHCQRALAGSFELPWQLSAGMRTLFLLPKITDNMGYNRLRLAYQLTAMKPLRNFYDQWHIFRQIAQHPDIAQSWRAKVLLVSKKPNLDSDSQVVWEVIQDYVKKDQQKLIIRYSRPISIDVLWQRFLEMANPQRFKLKSHLVDTIKHLYAIGAGFACGFVPVEEKDDVAPITHLAQAFTQVYKLRNYMPTFMYLSDIEQSFPKMVYYSLAFPQFVNHQMSHVVMSMSQRELFELKQAIALMKEYIKNPSFDHYQLKFFHVDSHESLGIEHSSRVPEEDNRFMREHFCASSIFWRGCIRLQKND